MKVCNYFNNTLTMYPIGIIHTFKIYASMIPFSAYKRIFCPYHWGFSPFLYFPAQNRQLLIDWGHIDYEKLDVIYSWRVLL